MNIELRNESCFSVIYGEADEIDASPFYISAGNSQAGMLKKKLVPALKLVAGYSA